MTGSSIPYEKLVQSALRRVVHDALTLTAESGLPGAHHFYIGFDTTHAGVQMNPDLRARFPKEMTIVLQHRFWDLKIADDHFAVTLTFNGAPERLTIPFAAITLFSDPEVKFALQFASETAAATPALESGAPAPGQEPAHNNSETGDDKVVSVDFLRRRSDK